MYRFRTRIISQFRSPENIKYLHDLFTKHVPQGPLRDYAVETLDDSVYLFSSGEGRAYDILGSDNTARRGMAASRATDFWHEVRRLNREFFEDRLSLLRDQAQTINMRRKAQPVQSGGIPAVDTQGQIDDPSNEQAAPFDAY